MVTVEDVLTKTISDLESIEVKGRENMVKLVNSINNLYTLLEVAKKPPEAREATGNETDSE